MSVGVIVTTYGEPTRNAFTDQWMYSYRILKRLTRKIAAIPAPVLPIIATVRARQRVALWREHDFISPLEPLHERTVAALAEQLGRLGLGSVPVTHAYEFRRPDLRDTLKSFAARGIERAVVVPMYIAGGDFTDGMTQIAVDDALAAIDGWTNENLTMCSLTPCETTAGDMAGLLAEHCVDSLRQRGLSTPADDTALLLAAHGTVINPPEGVDNGLDQFGRVLRRLQERLSSRFGLVRFGWLNHTKGGKWTTPDVSDALAAIRRRGYSRLVYFPWGFTTDNAETALEGRVAIAEMDDPFEHVEYLECINAAEPFVAHLARHVHKHLSERGEVEPLSTPAVPQAVTA